jgi:predicted GNAT family N-acyltransferase
MQALPCQIVDAADVRPLRHLVLRTGRPFSTCTWDGDDSPETRHFAIRDDDAVVAIGSLYHCSHNEWAPGSASWQLRGMASHPEHRGTGLGAQILQVIVTFCRDDLGGELVWCNARKVAEAFYHRYGFETMTPVFEIPNVGPHVVMRKNLTTPT